MYIHIYIYTQCVLRCVAASGRASSWVVARVAARGCSRIERSTACRVSCCRSRAGCARRFHHLRQVVMWQHPLRERGPSKDSKIQGSWQGLPKRAPSADSERRLGGGDLEEGTSGIGLGDDLGTGPEEGTPGERARDGLRQ